MSDDSAWRPPSDHQTGDGDQPVSDASGAPSLPTPSIPAAAPSIPVPPGLPSEQPVVPAPAISADVPAAAAPDPTGSPADVMHGMASNAPVPPETPSRSKRSKWVVGGMVAAVMAVGAAGVFAVSNLTQSSTGGAATTEELGLKLLEAIENEDVLGVVDVLSPGERDVFRDPLVELVSELTRLEVLSADADLSKLLGVDVEFDGESVAVVSTNVADIVNIDLRADATVTFDGETAPIGDLITDNLPDDMLTEFRGTRLTETDELDVRLTAVEQDGRWYFSVFHTIAEYARAEVAPSALIPVEGIGADAAATPEAAVDQLFDRVEALDLTGLLRTLNPGEAAALQRYSPLFLDEAESVLDEVPLVWKITRRDVRIEGSGDTRTVLLDGFGVEGQLEGEQFSVEYVDGCLSAEMAGDSFEACESELVAQAQWQLSPSDAPEIDRFINTVTDAFADVEESGLVLRRTDEGWFVSPVTTGSEAFLGVLRALDRTELDAIIEQAPPAFEELGDVFFGGINALPTSPELFEAVGDTDGSEGVDSGWASADESATVPEATAEQWPWEACYDITAADEAQACFNDLVIAGEIDEQVVPLVLRFPECNYHVGWDGTVFEMSDADFVATVERVRPCFLDLVAQGEVSEWELPTEIAHFECFEGRNWYTTYGDTAYDERYFECLNQAYDEG